MAGEYLDLTLLVNGTLDAFLLVFTGRLLGYPLRGTRVLAGVLVGEASVLLTLWFPYLWLSSMSIIVIPVLMIGVVFGTHRASFSKALLGLWILTVSLGGFIYAVGGFYYLEEPTGRKSFSLVSGNIWMLPLALFLWWLGQKVWQRWQFNARLLEQTLYELEIEFREGGEKLRVKGLLDTGNQLRDPLTGVPVLLLEEHVALNSLPAEWRVILQSRWQDLGDPWPLLWQDDGLWLKHFVFIPFKGIDRQSFLLAVRPTRIIWHYQSRQQEITATIALVPQTLDSTGQYQALLHSEHILKGGV